MHEFGVYIIRNPKDMKKAKWVPRRAADPPDARRAADPPGGVGDVQRAPRRERGYGSRRRQRREGGEREVPGHAVAQHERPELVRGEDGQRGAVDGRERRVLRREHGDAALVVVVVGGGVGLALERPDHVGPGEVVQERPVWPREGEQLGEVDVVRRWDSAARGSARHSIAMARTADLGSIAAKHCSCKCNRQK